MGAEQLSLEAGVLSELIELIYQHTGITMTEKKETLIRARLRPRMRVLNIPSFEGYISYLRSNQEEVMTFIDLVTTNETFFFRTTRIWDYFGKEFLERWKQKSPGRNLNIWSAAASSGEEAYSVAMTCLEAGVSSFKVLGTDISQEILAEAGRGQYAGRNLMDLQTKFPLLKEKYFDSNAESIKVKPVLKEHITFQQHNLFNPLKNPTKFDIVFLRNVLIYFKNEDQAKVIRTVSQHMSKGGILILGESESIFRLETSFKYVSPLIYVND